jgi:hypothetical protein
MIKRKHLFLVAVLLAPACGGGAGGDGQSSGSLDAALTGGTKATGEGPCDSAEECEGGVCVALIDGQNPPVYCTQECGSCPDGFFCDTQTFALAGLSFCRFGGSAGQADPPEEPPRLPCKGDEECSDGMVCATFMGERDCTIPCSDESACSISLDGFTFDMHTCGADQTPGEDRQVCLPDPSCFPDVQSCIELPF